MMIVPWDCAKISATWPRPTFIERKVRGWVAMQEPLHLPPAHRFTSNKQTKTTFPSLHCRMTKRRYNSRNSSLYFWVDDFMCSTLCGIQHGLWHSETYKTASKGFIKSWPSPSPSTCPKLTIPVWMTKVPTNVLKWRLLMTEKKVIHHKK